MDFKTPIENIKYIGEKQSKKLKKLKIHTLGDLLFYFPSHYEDFSQITEMKDLKINEDAVIKGKIMELNEERSFKKRISILTILLQDDSSNIEAIFFNQGFLKNSFQKGDELIVAGKLKFKEKSLYFSPTIFEKTNKNELTHLGKIMPVYRETKGLSSKYIRFVLKPLVDSFKGKLPETLPDKIIKEHDLMSFNEAFEQIHFPKTMEMAEKAKKRFIFEHLFFISLSSLKKKYEIKNEKAQKIEIKEDVIKRLKDSLPYKLTSAQEKVAKQILEDLNIPHPMNRLLQGDVGSGKTVVAGLIALNCIKNKTQAVLMAPTEILAKQHFKTLFDILKKFNVNVGLLTGKEDKYYSYKLKTDTIEISRTKLLEKCANGEIDILIGTQALIVKKTSDKKPKVLFKNLGLVVIDEQHRFGVKQRKELCIENNDKIPHLLSMTATPIPRSLALTIWGDLDLSIIDKMPKGRKQVKTSIVLPIESEKTYKFIEKELKKGNQCFVICPRIEEDENSKLDLKNVKDEFENLKKIFPKFKIDMLHGKMKPKEKDEIMKNFKKKKFDVLVSTSVIEVGIDIPDATVILIEGADRFGLAQLHQFRGRVGRSEKQSYCFLRTESPTKNTIQRLKAMEKHASGFELSEIDLKLRGPGDFFGVKQWGFSDYVMSALKDIKLVEEAREAAKKVFLKLENYPLTQKRLESFEDKVHIE
ncbi:MAG: ATP-dependent DNA helicase RecG [Candidatus Pacebacteria bacterium]|nr:ATP-dependent DNA helicase RecG [Candidatus Paceibacterota bacterium]